MLLIFMNILIITNALQEWKMGHAEGWLLVNLNKEFCLSNMKNLETAIWILSKESNNLIIPEVNYAVLRILGYMNFGRASKAHQIVLSRPPN